MFDSLIAFTAGLVWYEIVFCVVLFIGLLISLSEDFAALFGAVFVLFSIFFFHHSDVPFNVWTFSGYLIVYLVIGAIWSLFKWRQAVLKEKKYAERNYEGTESEKSEYIIEETKNRLDSDYSVEDRVHWIVSWPFGVIGYIFGDMIINAFEFIVQRLSKTYDKITNSILGS